MYFESLIVLQVRKKDFFFLNPKDELFLKDNGRTTAKTLNNVEKKPFNSSSTIRLSKSIQLRHDMWL